jgi:hypothetical protein
MSRLLKEFKIVEFIIVVLCLFITLTTESQILSTEFLALTIYNNNFGIVKDVRNINFDKG